MNWKSIYKEVMYIAAGCSCNDPNHTTKLTNALTTLSNIFNEQENQSTTKDDILKVIKKGNYGV